MKKFKAWVKKHLWKFIVGIFLLCGIVAIFLPRRQRDIVESIAAKLELKAQAASAEHETRTLLAGLRAEKDREVFTTRLEEIEKISDSEERRLRLIELKKEIMG